MSDDFFLSSLLAVKSSMIIVYPQAHTIIHKGNLFVYQWKMMCIIIIIDYRPAHTPLSSTRNASNLLYVDQGGEYAASDNVPPPSYDGQDFIEYSDMTTLLQGAFFCAG